MSSVRTKILRDTPLNKMSSRHLTEYINSQLDDWPCKLNFEEYTEAFRCMCNSVISMKLKCMTQAERDACYANKRKQKEVKQDVDTQIKNRHSHLRVHHIDV